MTNPLIVLTLSASIAGGGMTLRPSASVSAVPPLLAQALRIQAAAPAAPARRAGSDSLRNGAIAGAVMGGGAMLVQGVRWCPEASCASDVALWTALAAGAGAAIGAGIDALFDRQP